MRGASGFSGDLPPAFGRIAALALLAALLLLLWVAAVRPITDRATRIAAETEDARALIAGFERRAATGGGGPEIADLIGEIAESEVYLRGETEALAAAAMQRRIAGIAAEEGAEIRSAQSLAAAAAAADGLATVALRVAMEGSYEAVLRTIHRIETGTPVLIIERLELLALAGRDGAAPERFRAAVDVSGARPPEPPQ